jgi:5-(aminomethyl)-3-furanmethanol phosphate kinase
VTDAPPLVVKIGGGLLRAEGLAGLRRGCDEAGALAADRPVLVVPGGGPFADAVRDIDARLGLGDDLAHTLALQAMDQFGALLRPLLGDCPVVTELVAPHSLALLRAEPAFDHRPEIPRSWAVTSDSLAVFAAAALGAPEAVLLKAANEAGVDGYLDQAVRDTGVAVTVRPPT